MVGVGFNGMEFIFCVFECGIEVCFAYWSCLLVGKYFTEWVGRLVAGECETITNSASAEAEVEAWAELGNVSFESKHMFDLYDRLQLLINRNLQKCHLLDRQIHGCPR